MTASSPRRAAVIGLGSMGSGMAASLLRAGFSVAACDVNQEAVARFRETGGEAAGHPAAAAEGAVDGSRIAAMAFGPGLTAESALMTVTSGVA